MGQVRLADRTSTLWMLVALTGCFTVFGHGCGASDCTETLTCADTDASQNGDSPVDALHGPDVTDGANPVDSGDAHNGSVDAPFDSFVLPEGGDVMSHDGCPLGENCTNGIDDNCDGLVDCADPLCTSGYSCYAPIPNGWQGPIELWTGGTNPPSCTADYATDVLDANGMLNAPPAQCSCACGSVAGADCSTSVDWTAYSDGQCQTPCASGAMPPGQGSFCEAINCGNGGGNGSMNIVSGPPLLNIAACTPNPSTTLPNYSWQEVARGCNYTGPPDTGGCNGGNLCMAKPASPYGTGACIYATGDVGCPVGPYSNKQTFYNKVSDTRGCSQCTCGTPIGVTCSLAGSLSTYAFFGNPCTGQLTTIPPDGSCVLTTGSGVMGLVTATPTGGACPAANVAPTGNVTPAGPTTVCCTQ